MCSIGVIGFVVAASPAGAAAQETTDDGTRRFLLIALGLFALSALFGAGFLWYWRRTVPPARRAYTPPPIPLPEVRRRTSDRSG